MFKVAFIGLLNIKITFFFYINLVCLGDSGVGKTSIIQRFCSDNFKEAFSATIGVDLQSKMLNIDNRIIALQLWDTVRINFIIIMYSIIISLGWPRKVCSI